MSEQHTPFLTIFPECEALSGYAGGLDKAYVKEVRIEAQTKCMTVSAWFAAMPSPAENVQLGEHIRRVFALSSAVIDADYPAPKTAPRPAPAAPGAPKSAGGSIAGDVLYGRAIKQKSVPMSTVTLESGKITIEGDVVAVTSRTLQNGGGVLCFDMTDRTNSVRVSRYFRADDDKRVIAAVAVGDHLTVQGEIIYSKYDDDLVMDPRNIARTKKTVRPDNAPEKRVELHLHTRFSAMDALTDPAAVVKRAAYWGMPAVAVTDHGVAQAFPDMWKAGKKEGVKIIYGLEA